MSRLPDLFLALDGYFRQKSDDYAFIAGMIRQQTLFLVNINLARNDRITDVRKFWPLPWDDCSGDGRMREDLQSLSSEEIACNIERLTRQFEENG